MADEGNIPNASRTRSINADAAGAIRAARAGNCKDALKYLYDAAPHNQTRECGTQKQLNLISDFKQANIVVTQLCATNRTKKSKRAGGGSYDFLGRPSRRRKKRR